MPEQFWSGHHKAYAEEIHRHYTQLLDDLRTQRADADSDVERARLETEMNRVQTEYKSKLDSVNDVIF